QLTRLVRIRRLHLPRQNRSRSRPLTRTAARIHLDHRPRHGHAAGVELHEAATGLEGQFAAGFEDDLEAAGEVDFVAGFDELTGADLDVLAITYGQVVAGSDFGLAVAVGGAVFLRLEFAVGVGFHRIVALKADADLLIVLDVLVPIALGMHVDLFGALAVLDA